MKKKRKFKNRTLFELTGLKVENKAFVRKFWSCEILLNDGDLEIIIFVDSAYVFGSALCDGGHRTELF